MQNIKLLKRQAQKEISKIKDLKELDTVFRKYLGKRGKVTQILRSLKNFSGKKRKERGKFANQLKRDILGEIEKKRYKIQNTTIPVESDSTVRDATRYEIQKEWVDITVPGKKPILGHLHPLTQIQKKVEEIFQSMGFSVIDGPHVETEWYNFDALNIPKDHPARDAWNTLWLKPQEVRSTKYEETKKSSELQTSDFRLLLRTHTSPVQIRYMERNNPPLRIIVPGRVFRREATDASHEVNFYQIEGLMVDKDISVANFKAIIQEFFRKFFQKDTSIRMRTGYFPFTEPSFEIDMSCLNCRGKGCSACSQSGWLEMIGAGMVHPNIFKAAGLIPKNSTKGPKGPRVAFSGWQGFAFGMSLDRLAMMKYKINDIRLLYSGDLRFLNQF